MSAEFQKEMDFTTKVLQNTFCYSDDIIIFSIRSESEHMNSYIKRLKKLYYINLRIKFQKYHFTESEIEWFECKLTQTSILLLESKTAVILAV